ncbi:HK97 family phage portal protein [Anaerosolibacter carboniphilus]|uniref:HK97 family phage portal protein n=1 Tax=Anaerosolibacter carboniphilus TaxID=1417629 RepID=A0A841KSE9_9FIRM|nr:phage portal protein [Anaerosolibacter carboniphilus]MBB6214970.1 HK97 family phage portal protein [Anaerosolibacter carboniphilus]
MGLWSWFSGLFKDDGTLKLDVCVGEIAAEVYYKELAVQACVNLIANAVSRSEFLTYEKGQKKRGENYYLFNVEPNQNKSSSKFWRDVIHKLVYENECLVIQQDGKFYVADEFTSLKYAFKENIYKDIVIEGYQLSNTYLESQVFHFELHDEKIKTVVEGLYQSYGKLIAASQNYYKKNNAKRGTLKIPTSYPQTEQAQNDLTDLLSARFKKFFEATGGAVLPLTNGLEYDEIGSKTNSKTEGGSKEIRGFIDDIFDFVAIAFQVPPQLLKGNVADTDKAVNNFLTFCINPLAELLADEINRKLYGKKSYLENTYLKIDTTRIKSVDISDVAGPLEILLRIGSYSIDDCLEALGMEPLNTEWSRARWMTKNYERAETRAKGGGENGNA